MFSYCGSNPVMGYDPTGEINWSKLFSGAGLLAVGIMACLTAATVVSAGACAPLLIAAGATFVAGGMTIVNGTAEVVESFTGYNYMRDGVYGGDEAAYENQKDFYATAAEIGSTAISATAGLFDVCFVAGTVVLTAEGLEAIEDIKAGDHVWAFNEETDQVNLKRVVQTFVNETDELVHVHVNGEEIVCTPEHPFYSPVLGWTSAIHLRAGDILVTINGEYVIVEQIQHEILENPITVYNFEVEGFHTYYVGVNGILVHNVCRLAKEALLPTSGKIRYIPPQNVGPSLPRTSTGGYIDKFGNVWNKGPSRTIGEPFEWDVQLSRAGRNMLGWLSRDGRHLNVSLKGSITH